MSEPFVQVPSCWQCILFQGERETDRSFSARLEANHFWTGGEHTFKAGGRLILPRSAYEPIEEPSMIPVITSQQCRHGRRLCMTCTAESRAS